MNTYRVKNWREFQHYAHRDPPWIKLHFRMLSSRDWVTLDDASRVLAIACMLIASRNQGLIEDDPEYIQRVAYLKKPPDFKPLIKCGFLELASESKQVLATASVVLTNDVSETERETEEECAKRPPLANGFHGKPKPKKTHTPPTDFKPDLEFASLVVPDMDAAKEAEKFMDYEFRTPHSDWDRAWRRWVRKARDDNRYTKRAMPGVIQWQ